MKRKILLDILMGAIILSLLNVNITGMQLHEILGIAIFFLFALHKIFNRKWITAVTKNLWKPTVKPKAKILYAVDVILLVLVILNVGSGILISTHLFPGITPSDMGAASRMHHIFAYLLVATLIVHIGLHWAYIRNGMKIKKGGFAEKLVVGVLAAILIVILSQSNTVKRILPPHREGHSQHQAEKGENKKDKDDRKETEKGHDRPTETQPKEEDQEEADPIPEDSTAADGPPLEEFLSKLICYGCGRRCPLTNPQCGRGRREQQQKVEEYNQTYGTNETYESPNHRRP